MRNERGMAMSSIDENMVEFHRCYAMAERYFDEMAQMSDEEFVKFVRVMEKENRMLRSITNWALFVRREIEMRALLNRLA